MTFDAHVSYISRKVFYTIVYINRIKDNFSRKARLTLIQSLVLSIMNYGIKIWSTANTTLMNQVEKLQNFAAKVALGGGVRRDHATPYLKEYKYDLGVLFIIQLRETFPVMCCHCLRCGMRPVSTRQQLQLCVPRTNTCTGFQLKDQNCGTVSPQRSSVLRISRLLRKVCGNI